MKIYSKLLSDVFIVIALLISILDEAKAMLLSKRFSQVYEPSSRSIPKRFMRTTSIKSSPPRLNFIELNSPENFQNSWNHSVEIKGKALEDSNPVKKYLMVANGEWNTELVKTYMPGRFVIALDGAAYKFYESSLLPHAILGDFDSLEEKYQEHHKDYFNVKAALQHFRKIPVPMSSTIQFEEYKHPDTPIAYVRAYAQGYTDLSKGIEFCLTNRQKNDPVDIVIACALGGDRIDHALGNFSVLKRYRSSQDEYYNVSLRIVNKLQYIEVMSFQNIENTSGNFNTKVFTGKVGDKCGFFGFPSAKFESRGLKWELDGFPLEIGKSESSSNELKDSSASLTIREGTALIMIPNIDFNK